jgi:large-conductance mechanosensitive channel
MPRKIIGEFKKFIARGNVIDLAVGILSEEIQTLL